MAERSDIVNDGGSDENDVAGERNLAAGIRPRAEAGEIHREDGKTRECMSPTTDHDHSSRYVWYVVILLTIVNAVNYMDRMALAVLAPLVKADLQLSDAQLGLLIGFAFSLFYAVCGIPIARWADRGVRRDIIAIAVATWSVMTILCGAAQSLWQLFVARIGVGAGEAGSFAPGSSIICDYVPLSRRSGVFSVHTFGIYGGMMIGMVLAGWLGQAIGWRWTFVAFGLPGLVLAVIVRLTLREPRRGFFESANANADASEVSLSRTVGVLWRCKTYRLLALFLVVNGFVQYGLSQWWPSFYSRVFGLSLSSLGVSLGIAIGVGSGIGLLAGGLLSNKAAQRDVRLPLMIGAAATTLALPAALGTLFLPSASGSLLLVSVSALFWSASTGPAIASIYSVTAPRMRATAGGIYIFLTAVFGFGLGPFSVGWLSDILLPSLGVESLRYAMLLPIGFFPVLAISLYAAGKALPDDLRVVSSQPGDDSATASPTKAMDNADGANLREPSRAEPHR